MSAARNALELLRAAFAVFGSIVAWLAIVPVARFVPKRSGRICVIGRDSGYFVDNCKYFFAQASVHAPDLEIVFVSEKSEVVDQVRRAGYRAARFPAPTTLWLLIRSGTCVVDSNEWRLHLRRFLLAGARIIQLWHGVGSKRIGKEKCRNEAPAKQWLQSPWLMSLRFLSRRITGRDVKYDVVLTTSEFYRDNVFVPAFNSDHFLVAGYPRNTFGCFPGADRGLLWTNVDREVAASLPGWTSSGRRIVLVTPTFRDSRATPLGLTPEVLGMLDRFCEEHGVEFVFKFHPHERGASQVSGRHLHLCAPDADLYPVMAASAALVTDYSSIYMDYLLLQKPVLFLVPDLETYLSSDRQLQFDFDKMTPGPKARDWRSLLAALLGQWNHDDFVADRMRLCGMAFDGLPQQEAVPKLVGFMRQQRWLPPVSAERP